jgi:NAD(P)-dependent dehydrogenase (short-subunit alcohol dehydrogenase family)
MPNTVLITGASTGIGNATARRCLEQGWNVIATMRNPDQASELAQFPNCLRLALDVTQPEMMPGVVEAGISRFGAIDVLINNAGYALVGPFEVCAETEIRRQFETNVFGLMAMTRAVLPHFRQRRSGTIINIASIGGQMAFPLYSSYHSTKWAVEGFTESLRYELAPLNIQVKLIEPGPIKTDFYQRSLQIAKREDLTAYDAYVDQVYPALEKAGEQGSPPEVVAQAIYQAMTDRTDRLRYPTGGNAGALIGLRKILPDALWQAFLQKVME